MANIFFKLVNIGLHIFCFSSRNTNCCYPSYLLAIYLSEEDFDVASGHLNFLLDKFALLALSSCYQIILVR